MNFFEDAQELASNCSCPVLKLAPPELRWTYKKISGNGRNKDSVDILVIQEMQEPLHIQAKFNTFVKWCTGMDRSYVIIKGLGCTPGNMEDMTNSASHYVKCKKLNIDSIIKRYNPKVILTSGRAIYTITENSDLRAEHFFSTHEDDVWLYDNNYKCRVYPLPPIFYFIDHDGTEKDNWYNEFAKLQFDRAKDHISRRKRPVNDLILHNMSGKENEFIKRITEDESIEYISVDIETTGFNYWHDDIISIQFAYNETEGFFLHWKNIDTSLLTELLRKKKQVYHNGKFDTQFLRAKGIDTAYISHDTMLMAHSVNENCRVGLKPLTHIHTPYGGYEREIKGFLKKLQSGSFADIPEDILLKYAVTDAIITFILYKYYMKRLAEESKVEENYRSIIIPAINMLTEVEMHGIMINEKYIYEYNDLLLEELKEVDRQMIEYAGDINLGSLKQLSNIIRKDPNFQILSDDKGNPLISKTGDLVLNKDTIPLYADMGIVLCEFLAKRNNLRKEISQLGIKEASDNIEFIKELSEGLFDREDSDMDVNLDTLSEESGKGIISSVVNGKLYGSYNLSGTETGRLSSSGGLRRGGVNLQNFTKRIEFRKIFYPSPGYLYLETDFASMEITQGSQTYGSGMLEKVLLEGMDFHSMTGTKIYEIQKKKSISYERFIELKEAGDPEINKFRKQAKFVNFSTTYGATEYGMAHTLGVTPDEAREFMNLYYRLYPEIKEYFDEYRTHAKEYGYVESLLGKRRRLPELMHDVQNFDSTKSIMKRRNNLLNSAINFPIQSLSGQTTLIAMTEIHAELKRLKLKSRVLANVHDSILTEVHESEVDVVKELVERIMTKPRYKNRKGNKCKLGVDHVLSHIWGFSDEEKR